MKRRIEVTIITLAVILSGCGGEKKQTTDLLAECEQEKTTLSTQVQALKSENTELTQQINTLSELDAKARLESLDTLKNIHIGKHSGFYDDAIKEAEINLQIDPKHADSIALIALVYNLQGKNDKAVEKLKEAIDIEPDEYGHHYSLGKLYWKLGKKDEALKELEILKKLNVHSYELLRDIIYGVPLSQKMKK